MQLPHQGPALPPYWIQDEKCMTDMKAAARVTCLRIPVSSGAFCPWLLPLHSVLLLLHLPGPSSSSSLALSPRSLAHSARAQSSCHSALPSQGCCCPGNTVIWQPWPPLSHHSVSWCLGNQLDGFHEISDLKQPSSLVETVGMCQCARSDSLLKDAPHPLLLHPKPCPPTTSFCFIHPLSH